MPIRHVLISLHDPKKQIILISHFYPKKKITIHFPKKNYILKSLIFWYVKIFTEKNTVKFSDVKEKTLYTNCETYISHSITHVFFSKHRKSHRHLNIYGLDISSTNARRQLNAPYPGNTTRGAVNNVRRQCKVVTML